jgi:hypothetical protein
MSMIRPTLKREIFKTSRLLEFRSQNYRINHTDGPFWVRWQVQSEEEMEKPPDLQKLVADFGGYNKITPEGWAEFDRLMTEYQQRRREVIAREIKDYRQAKKEEAKG